MTIFTSAFGGTADMARLVAGLAPVENDPTEILRVHRSIDFISIVVLTGSEQPDALISSGVFCSVLCPRVVRDTRRTALEKRGTSTGVGLPSS
jgi:hypothetical protein